MTPIAPAHALDLIKTALESGSIKLQQGPIGTKAFSIERGEVDALYLLSLLHNLTHKAAGT